MNAAPPPPILRSSPSPTELAEKILSGDRVALARGITLVESDAPKHAAAAERLVEQLLPSAGKSRRIGITGVPGVGKSSLIETLGCFLCDRGLKIAVLAVDPSSTLTRGSILGDKTRMEELCRRENAFIRPSPSAGTLGGVARKSRETLILCEAAGHDVVIVETVGVGQSETTVRSMVDLFLLLALAGAGDDLQGIKKGIMELADLIAVTKADGDNVPHAMRAASDLAQVLHYIAPATEGWETPVLTVSAHSNSGLDDLWAKVDAFFENGTRMGWLAQRRREQTSAWFRSLLEETLLREFHARENTAERMAALEAAVILGEMNVPRAVREMLANRRPDPSLLSQVQNSSSV